MKTAALRHGLAALAALCALATGAAAADPPEARAESAPGAEARPNPQAALEVRVALDAQIAALEADVAREQEQLKALVSEPAEVEGRLFGESPEIRESAQRLPALQARLRALREQRQRLTAP